MRCRRIKVWYDENNTKHTSVVWFGSYGIDDNDNAKFVNPHDKHDNFADKQQGVADSLTQRLSVIKKELWYNVSYGLPLFDKQKSKLAIDAFVGSTITSHPDVVSIKSFDSKVVDKKYTCNTVIITKYGEMTLNL